MTHDPVQKARLGYIIDAIKDRLQQSLDFDCSGLAEAIYELAEISNLVDRAIELSLLCVDQRAALLQATRPREDVAAALEALHQHTKLSSGNYDYQCGFLDALKEAKAALSVKNLPLSVRKP
jgi:hypothetical protein